MSCFICNDKHTRQIKSLNGYKVLECLGCGLQFLDPKPNQKALDEIYKDYYKAWGINSSEDVVSSMKRLNFKSYIYKITKYITKGKLLDIGCATGELMLVAQDKGFDVYGVEVSPYGIEKCKQLFDVNKILSKKLEMGDFPKDFFDIITLADVIEHIQEPKDFFNTIIHILKPGGILMIVTPDTSSWISKMMGSHWMQYKHEHLYYYNRKNIKRYLNKFFNELFISGSSKVLVADYCINVLSAQYNNVAVQKLMRLLKSLPGFIRFYPFKISVGEMFVLLRKRRLQVND